MPAAGRVAAATACCSRRVVRAPHSEGRYLLVWDMVHERTTWFSGQGVAPGSVPVAVAPAAAAAPRRRPRPARRRAASPGGRAAGSCGGWPLGMWRERPLHGRRVRQLPLAATGRAAGRPFVGRAGVRQQRCYLEAAATTGRAGPAGAAGHCWRRPGGLRRAARRGPERGRAAVAAASSRSLAALAVHGVVDYVLAFTGHYLVFGVRRCGGPSPACADARRRA